MTRKGENIYKRKDGRWEGRYKKGRKENGQLKYGYIYGKTYGEVKKELYHYNLKYQPIIQLNGESTLTYEEWGLIWLKQQETLVKTSTYTTYYYKLRKYVFPIIGKIPLNKITTQKINLLIEEWKIKGLETSTIHCLFQIVKKTLKEAWEQKKIIQVPCNIIRLPKKKKNKAKSLTKLEQKILENEVKSLPFYKGLPVLLALHAGLRIGEISALKWSDVDLEKRTIHVHQTYQRLPLQSDSGKTYLVLDSSKTESSDRIIPMSISLHKNLKNCKNQTSSLYVCSNRSKPIEPRLITYHFHHIREKCGIITTHFHQLRHTFATRCIEANGDIASISKLLGHTSTKTTLDIYVDSFIENQQRVINQMEAAQNF